MKRWCIALMIMAAALAGGCNKNGKNQNSADVRVLNAVVDAEALDFLVDDDVKQSGVAVGSTTGYASFNSGGRTVKVRSAVNGTQLLEKAVNFPSGSEQTLVAYGRRATMGLLILLDDTSDPASGKFRVRAVGLSADSGPVDVYILNGDISGVPAVLISAVAFTSVTDYAEVAEGDYRIVYTASGTKEVLFESPTSHWSAGTKNTLTVFPTAGGRLVSAAFLTPGSSGKGTFIPNTRARVKAVNAIPDSTTLTFFSGTTPLLSTVPFMGVSTYVTTTAASQSLRIEASNVPGTTVASRTQALGAGLDYTLLAVNATAQASLTVLPDNNAFPSAGKARVRFVNALVGAGSVDVSVDFASQATGIAYNTASDYIEITAGTTYTVSFASAGGVNALASLTPVEFVSGAVHTVYLFGTGTSGTIKVARDR
jgi:Domain of unknown function (DUF4397)